MLACMTAGLGRPVVALDVGREILHLWQVRGGGGVLAGSALSRVPAPALTPPAPHLPSGGCVEECVL